MANGLPRDKLWQPNLAGEFLELSYEPSKFEGDQTIGTPFSDRGNIRTFNSVFFLQKCIFTHKVPFLGLGYI